MLHRTPIRLWLPLIVVAVVAISACGQKPAPAPDATARTDRYEDLLTLFDEWRAFQHPKRTDGAPDYSEAAMDAQRKALAGFQARLASFDTKAWPVDRRVDYHIVRAEMNGMEFDHRVLRPWANNPKFYVTVFPDESDQPAREGPWSDGAVELWQYAFPLSDSDAAAIETGLRIVPALLAQAQKNLVGTGRDLWTYGTRSVKEQATALEQLAARVPETATSLKDAIGKARSATEAFAVWLDAQAAARTGPSGIGIEHYNWYLKNVQLVPLTWRDEVMLMERELARAGAFLSLEEQRNAALPAQSVVGSADEHAKRFPAAVRDYVAFLRDRGVMRIRDYHEPALLDRVGRFSDGPREFFTEVDYRDPSVMRTHGFHWFDKARMRNDPHPSPIRKGALLYNIFVTRTEGHATGWEELMLQAGMFDGRPRSRELIYVLLAERAARALGDLRMHSREFTLEQAAEFASANTPRGWLSLAGNLVRGEQHLYLEQPAYGTSYVVGKIQVERLLAARKQQQGDAFRMADFMEAFEAAGLIPMSLIEWQLTGTLAEDVRQMLGE